MVASNRVTARLRLISHIGLSRIFKASVLVAAALLFSSQPALAQFTQQGPKLVGSGAVGQAIQGFSVALSANGNTAIVGGAYDNGFAGAVWVFTRSGGVWTQQGSKLVGTGAIGPAQQGYSVGLSADGNTAIVGGPCDQSNCSAPSPGATWVFTRSGADRQPEAIRDHGQGVTQCRRRLRTAFRKFATAADRAAETTS
jgi:hypothetical protein